MHAVETMKGLLEGFLLKKEQVDAGLVQDVAKDVGLSAQER